MRRRPLLLLLPLLLTAVWATNRRWVAPERPRPPTLLAHRGLAQDFDRAGLTGETCTAARMRPPRHGYLENTIPSLKAAFAAGADRVEIDVHPTTDGHFVVFHDWTLDCRTDGHGVTRDHSLAELQALDVGYGYTADQGQTYPFRGAAVGGMPSLDQVLSAFPDHKLLINIKSGDPNEGALLADALARLPPERLARLAVSGHEAPVAVVADRIGLAAITKPRLKACLLPYIALGWTGFVPDACHHTLLYVPINVAPWLWGWPYVFVDRMRAADAEVYALAPWTGGWSDGLNTPEDLARLPPDYEGGILTDEIDLVAPRVARPAVPPDAR